MKCFNNDYLLSLLISELDTNNNLHSFDFNFTGNITDLNTSQINFPNAIWVVRPTWEVALKTTLFLPVIIGGILGNLILLNVIWKTKRTNTPTSVFIGSMAIVDLLTLLLCPWMFLVHQFYQNYVLGSFGCKMEGFLSGSFLIMDVMFLSAVSCDRLMAIILPREARLTKKGAFRLILIAVVLGILIALPLCIYRTYKERQWLDFLETYCSENVKILPIYWHVLLSTLVWFPLIVMVICYSAIFWKLDQYEKENLRREHPMVVNYKTRVARTLFIVLVTFILCRLPFTVLVYWRSYLLKKARINSIGPTFQTLWFFSHYLISLNCALNPLMYGLTNKYYKKILITMPIYKWFSGKNNNARECDKNIKNTMTKTTDSNQKNIFYRLWPCSKKNKTIFSRKPETISESGKIDSPKVVCSRITPINEDYI